VQFYCKLFEELKEASLDPQASADALRSAYKNIEKKWPRE
jgi:hypothetical protein